MKTNTKSLLLLSITWQRSSQVANLRQKARLPWQRFVIWVDTVGVLTIDP